MKCSHTADFKPTKRVWEILYVGDGLKWAQNIASPYCIHLFFMLICSKVCKLSVMYVCFKPMSLENLAKTKDNESTDKSLGGKFSIELDLELHYCLECEKENNVEWIEFREKGKLCIS